MKRSNARLRVSIADAAPNLLVFPLENRQQDESNGRWKTTAAVAVTDAVKHTTAVSTEWNGEPMAHTHTHPIRFAGKSRTDYNVVTTHYGTVQRLLNTDYVWPSY